MSCLNLPAYLDSDTEDPTEQDDYHDGNPDNSRLNNTDCYSIY